MILLFIFFTFLYSYRIYFLFNLVFGGSFHFLGSSVLLGLFSVFLCLFSVLFLWFFNVCFFQVPQIFLFFDKLVSFFMVVMFLLVLGLGLFLIGFLFQYSMFFIEDLVFFSQVGLSPVKFSDFFLLFLNFFGFYWFYGLGLKFYFWFFGGFYSYVYFVGALIVVLFCFLCLFSLFKNVSLKGLRSLRHVFSSCWILF